MTSTLSPSATPPVLTADHETAVGSIIAPCSQVSASGIRKSLVGVDEREVGHAAPGMAQTDRGTQVAHLLLAAATHRTFPAAAERHHRHAVAARERVDVGADLDDLGRQLVAEDLRHVTAGQRMRLDGRPQRSRRVLVDIGAADAGEHRRDQHLAAGRATGCLHLLVPDVLGGMETERAHLRYSTKRLVELSPDLTGEVAVVTGGAGGLGAAVAVAFAHAGAHVAVTDLDADGAYAVASELEGAAHLGLEIDVRSTESVREVADAVSDRLGPPSILFCGAGVQRVRPTLEVTDEDWDFVVDINLGGTFRCCRAFGAADGRAAAAARSSTSRR